MRTTLTLRNRQYGPNGYQARLFTNIYNDRARGDALGYGLPPDIAPRQWSAPQASDQSPPAASPFSSTAPAPASITNQPIVDHLRYGDLYNIEILAGTSDQLILPRATETRTYLFITNTHVLQTLFVNFGAPATLTNGIPIAPAGGFWEFNVFVPQGDIHILGSGAGTTGVLSFSERVSDVRKHESIMQSLSPPRTNRAPPATRRRMIPQEPSAPPAAQFVHDREPQTIVVERFKFGPRG